jgi:repressor LexA
MYFTEKQLRIMEFIKAFREERGISPTLEEIAANFGVTKITIYEHINQLERKGALKREKFRARSIELLVEVEERTPRYSLPLRGSLGAGVPFASGEGGESVNLSEMIPFGKNCFALRVEGNGMVDDHITDGDIVIVEPRADAKEGETVVAILKSGEARIGRYRPAVDGVRLGSTNGSNKETLVKEPKIRGVVLGVLRRFD